jgi:hypothetical protein
MPVISAVEWVPVESGVFAAAAYRERTRQLYLQFRDGRIYRYFECPVSVCQEFLTAESKGSYFSQHIRNQFRHELIYRNDGGNPGESLEQQLSNSVLLAEARAAQKREAAHAAGVQDGIR